MAENGPGRKNPAHIRYKDNQIISLQTENPYSQHQKLQQNNIYDVSVQ